MLDWDRRISHRGHRAHREKAVWALPSVLSVNSVANVPMPRGLIYVRSKYAAFIVGSFSFVMKGSLSFVVSVMAGVFPLIATARLMMRPFETDDVDALHLLWTDPGVRKFLWDDRVIPRETAVDVVESSVDGFVNHGFGLWAIRFENDVKLIGFAGLRHFTEDCSANEEVELLYGVTPELWGKGIAPEAARAVVRYGFEELRLANIYAGADPPNTASFRVIEKLGMKFARKTVVNGLEAVYYVLSRKDYKVHFDLDSKIGVK